MAVFHCKCCGAELPLKPMQSTVCCYSCGISFTVPATQDAETLRLLDTAWQLYRKDQIRPASGIFSTVINQSPQEPEAHWGALMCRFGIFYEPDGIACRKAVQTSILDDPALRAVMDHADPEARNAYMKDAFLAEELRKLSLQAAYPSPEAGFPMPDPPPETTETAPEAPPRKGPSTVAALHNIFLICLISAVAIMISLSLLDQAGLLVNMGILFTVGYPILGVLLVAALILRFSNKK